MDHQQRLARVLDSWGLAPSGCERLAGDVSHRSYFRLHGDLAPDAPTAVAMVVPFGEAAKMVDWVAVGAWLDRHGVPVPAVYRRDDDACVLLIEDIGDELLTEVHDRSAADAWYVETLAHLARVEAGAGGERSDASPAHGRKLEETRIRWELRRFRKAVAGFVRDLSPDEEAAWKAGEDAMFAALDTAPKAWMHRDLHARNLLVHRGEAVWIDHQDAMIGPWLYDVASLLLDPYAALTRERREPLLDAYLALPGRVHAGLEPAAVNALWATVSVQRLVHCIACYVWVAEHEQRTTYLRYLPHAVRELRAAMDACPAAESLAGVMAPRWQAVLDRWSPNAVRP